jgi:hypothetical protein
MSELGKLGWNRTIGRLYTNTNIERVKKKTYTDEDNVDFITAVESVYNDRYLTELIANKKFKKLLEDIADIKELIEL